MRLGGIIEDLGDIPGKKTVVSVTGAGGKTTCVLELSRTWAEEGQYVLAGTTTHMEDPEALGVPGAVDVQAGEIRKQMRREGWILAGTPSGTEGKITALPEDLFQDAGQAADRIVLEADGARRFPVKVPGQGEPVIRQETTHILILAGLSALGRTLKEVCHRLPRALAILGGEPGQILTAEKLGILLEQGYVQPLRKAYPETKIAAVLNQADQAENLPGITEEIKSQVSVPVYVRTRQQEVHLIYLAAGFSRRFGENKLLWKLGEKPMYLHLLDRLQQIWQEGKVRSLTVVTQYQEIAEEMRRRQIPAVINPDSSRGIASSLGLGLGAASGKGHRGEEQFYCFFVADQPQLEKETIEGFLEEFLKSKKGIGCAAFEGTAGNPVIFQERYRDELLGLSGDTGGKKVVKRHPQDVFLYEVRKEELKDWDYK